LIPILGFTAGRIYDSGRCDGLGGEFVTFAGGAGWECLLPADFGDLPVEQNYRIDLRDAIAP